MISTAVGIRVKGTQLSDVVLLQRAMEDDKMLLVTTAHVVEDRTILENLF